jgi:thiamine-phosphate pyrophosphorylase
VQQAGYAIRARIDMLQVRERDLEACVLVALVKEIVSLARGTKTKIVVSDRVDVALAGGADGVNLRGDSVSAGVVRRIVPPGFLIGRSVHSVEEAAAAESDVDYLIAGTVWGTESKGPTRALLGVSGLAAITKAVTVPVLAIGGVTLERLHELRACGTAGAASIGLFVGSRESAREGCRAVPLEAVAAAAQSV